MLILAILLGCSVTANIILFILLIRKNKKLAESENQNRLDRMLGH